MRKISKLVLALVAMITLFTVGCQKQDQQKNISESTGKVWNSTVSNITAVDFQHAGVFWTSEDDVSKMIEDKKIGNSVENPIVAISFDENGILYTNEKFNKDILNLKPSLEAWTDLATFAKVTNSPYATSAYSDVINGVWSLDVFVKFFTTRQEKEKQASIRFQEAKKNANLSNITAFSTSTTPSIPYWGQKGIILYGEFAGGISSFTGHTAGVTTELAASYSTTTQKMNNTWITEALYEDGVNTKRMTNSTGTSVWNVTGISNRTALWLTSLTSTQRTNIASYQTAQAGKSYKFFTTSAEKTRTDRWYCSKLQWRAYLDKTGIDIDKDGGGCVYPMDIYNNTSMYVIAFGLL